MRWLVSISCLSSSIRASFAQWWCVIKTCLLRCRASSRIEFLSVFISLSSLSHKLLLLIEKVWQKLNFFSNTCTFVFTCFCIGEIWETRDFVYLSFQLAYDTRRTIFYDELDCIECFYDTAPFKRFWILKTTKEKIHHSADILPVETINNILAYIS